MNLIELRRSIISRRLKGDSYNSIGAQIGIHRSLVKYIETHPGYSPSQTLIERLKLTRTPSQLYTLSRRQRLDKIARLLGYASWSEYETLTLRYFDI